MKLRYIAFFIVVCLVLFFSYRRIMNSTNFNNNTEQLETKLDPMNTIDEVPVQVTEQDNESDLFDKRIIDDTRDEVKTIEDKPMENEPTETNINDINANEPNRNNDDYNDMVSSTSFEKLFRAIDRKDSYNNELQYYITDNVSITENKITITSKKEDKDGKKYTSGLVESRYAYLNGYFEFTVNLSYGKGIFPAIWFMPADFTSYPEIDLFEMVGSQPQKFYGVIHYLNENNKKSRDYFSKKVELKDSYKLALQWNSDELIWYIDDNIVHRTTSGVPNQYMYIIINQAVGGNWPGEPDADTVFPSEYTIKDIKINPINQQLR